MLPAGLPQEVIDAYNRDPGPSELDASSYASLPTGYANSYAANALAAMQNRGPAMADATMPYTQRRLLAAANANAEEDSRTRIAARLAHLRGLKQMEGMDDGTFGKYAHHGSHPGDLPTSMPPHPAGLPRTPNSALASVDRRAPQNPLLRLVAAMRQRGMNAMTQLPPHPSDLPQTSNAAMMQALRQQQAVQQGAAAQMNRRGQNLAAYYNPRGRQAAMMRMAQAQAARQAAMMRLLQNRR